MTTRMPDERFETIIDRHYATGEPAIAILTECRRARNEEQRLTAEMNSIPVRLESLLDEVRNPASVPVGAPNSAMRRAWEIGRELAEVRTKLEAAERDAAQWRAVTQTERDGDVLGAIVAETWRDACGWGDIPSWVRERSATVALAVRRAVIAQLLTDPAREAFLKVWWDAQTEDNKSRFPRAILAAAGAPRVDVQPGPDPEALRIAEQAILQRDSADAAYKGMRDLANKAIEQRDRHKAEAEQWRSKYLTIFELELPTAEKQRDTARAAAEAAEAECKRLQSIVDLYGDHQEKYEAWLLERDAQSAELEALRRVAEATRHCIAELTERFGGSEDLEGGPLDMATRAVFEALAALPASPTPPPAPPPKCVLCDDTGMRIAEDDPAKPTYACSCKRKQPLAGVPRGHCGRCDRCGSPLGGLGQLDCSRGFCMASPRPPERTHCAGCGATYETSASDTRAQSTADSNQRGMGGDVDSTGGEVPKTAGPLGVADEDLCPVSKHVLASWGSGRELNPYDGDDPGWKLKTIAWLYRETERLKARLERIERHPWRKDGGK